MTFIAAEKHQSQAPALQLLVALGFTPLSQEEVLRLRGGRLRNVVLDDVLAEQLMPPAVSEQRLSITSNGKVRYQLKTPYRDGTTHVFFEPLDFMARLASLVPKPRINLTRFHGVFAPNSKFRGHLTTAKRGKGGEKPVPKNHDLPDMETLRFKQTWMQALKRVFNIDLEWCQHCGKQGEVSDSIKPLR